MFKKIMSLVLAFALFAAVLPAVSLSTRAEAPPVGTEKAVPALSADAEGEDTRQINTQPIAIDNNPNGGYTGDYVVIYNPSESSGNSKSTGNMSGRIQTSINADLQRADFEDAKDGEQMYRIDVDAEMEKRTRELESDGIEPPAGIRASYNVGDRKTFTISAYSPLDTNSVEFKVLYKTDHCYVWTPTSTNNDIYPLSSEDAQTAALEFENKFALMQSSFGDHNQGSGGDGRVHILYYNINDGWQGGGYVGGYFYGGDYNINGLPMLHIDTYPSIYYNNHSVADAFNTVVHEYQHMINYSAGGTPTWLNESMSAAAEEICYPGSSIFSRIMTYTGCPWSTSAFANPPREYATQHENLHRGYSMYSWDQDIGDILALYAQVSLFSQYLYTRSEQGNGVFKALLTQVANGSSFQQACPVVFGMTASELVRDFRIALTANTSQNVLGGKYRFALQQGYNPSEYYNVANPYNILGPIVFTDSSCNIKGGGAITIKPVGGAYIPPDDSDPNLLYYGITLNAPQDVPPVEPTPTPQPTQIPSASTVWDFESDPMNQGFEFRDQDGDGYNWEWKLGAGFHHHEGNGCAFSASYTNNVGALTPDNWAITPEFTGTWLTFWAQGQDASWAEEYLGIFVSTNGGSSWSNELTSFTLTGTDTQYSVNLSAYEGQSIRVAIRHYNVTDMFAANIDYIEIGGASAPVTEPPATEPPVTEPPVTVPPISLDEALNAEGGTLHFESTGSYPWIAVEDGDRIYAKSGNAGVASSESVVSTTVQSNGYIRIGFEFKAWGEGTRSIWDKCEFIIDGTVVATWGAYQNSEWEEYLTDNLASGTHTVQWRYTKDSSVDKPEDCFMVDNVMLAQGLPEPPAVVIGNVEITNLTLPAWGEHPSYSFNTPANAPYSVTDFNWALANSMDDTEATELTAADVFNNPDKIYAAVFVLEPEIGYEFADNCTVTVNGETSIVYDAGIIGTGGSMLVLVGPFTVTAPTTPEPTTPAPTLITSVEILDLEIPVWGAHPNFTVNVPVNVPYSVDVVIWRDRTIPGAAPMNENSVFNDPNAVYGMTLTLDAAAGYAFADEVTATINGDASLFNNSYDYNGQLAVNSIGFTVTEPTTPDPTTPAPTLISSVEITSLVIPEYGEAPVYTVSVPTGAHYTVDRVEWYARNGDFLLGNVPGAVFDDTTESYEATTILTAAEGYAFADTVTATINGETGLVEHLLVSSGELGVVSVGFTVTEPTTPTPTTPEPTTPAPSGIPIETVELLNFVEPVWGAEPSSGVTVPEGANYTITEQGWYYYAGVLHLLQPGDRFDVEGRSYSMSFTIVPDEGYYLVKPDSLVVTINGSEDLVGSVFVFGGESARIDTVDFTVEPPILIDTIEINDFVVPTWGAAPFYDVTVPEDAPYSIGNTTWHKHDEINGGDNITMQPGETFNDENFSYYQYFRIMPNEGYDFADEVTVLINGETTYISHGGYNFAWGFGYYYIFTINFFVEAPDPIWGDANGDGVVTTEDALLLMRHIMELDTVEEVNLEWCDVNGDGIVSLLDALLIMRYAMGVVDGFPVQRVRLDALHKFE